MFLHRLIIAAAASHLAASPSAAQPGESDPYADLVRVLAFTETTGVAPGETVWIGVHFDIKAGWHTYWPGQNDSGFGTTIEIAAPEGFGLGRVHWPAPKRYLAPGDILDHVHEDAVTALIPVTAPADAQVGSSHELSIDLSWLVCEDVCIPGWETVSVQIPILETHDRVVGRIAKHFADARERLPAKPTDSETVRITWHGSTAQVRVDGVKNLSFYPDEGGSAINDLATSGITSSGVLKLSFDAPEPVLSGVLEIHGSGDESQLFVIHSVWNGEDQEP